MSKLFLGKVNLSKIDKTKLFDGKTGKWMDITIWINSEPDQYGNNLSIEQSTKKGDPKIFIGNAKEYVKKENPLPDKQGQYQGSGAMSDINELPGANDDNPDNMPF